MRNSATRPRIALALVLLSLLSLLPAGCAGDGQAILNILDYRLRKAFPPLLVTEGPRPAGSLAGTLRDVAGQPLSGAVALVATARGQVFSDRSDEAGHYRIDGIPPGRYVPLAAAWGYGETTQEPVRVTAGQEIDGVDFSLAPYRPAPVEPTDLQIGSPQESFSQFPEPSIAARYPFTFTLDGFEIGGGQIYLPAQGAETEDTLPTLVIIYPSQPLNWDPASVALTQPGYAVLALGVDSDRGLDIAGHVRDFRAALQLWQEGKLVPLGEPTADWIPMSGSFGSLILFRALRDLAVAPPALVNIGGVSDAFLGVQALYGDTLAIPPPYDMAVAAMGRPDRDPAFFFAYSPVFFAEQLPPTFILHMVNDEVIPHDQAEALARALEEAGVPYHLLLYTDTTHYLDARYPTEATFMVFDQVMDFVAQTFAAQ